MDHMPSRVSVDHQAQPVPERGTLIGPGKQRMIGPKCTNGRHGPVLPGIDHLLPFRLPGSGPLVAIQRRVEQDQRRDGIRAGQRTSQRHSATQAQSNQMCPADIKIANQRQIIGFVGIWNIIFGRRRPTKSSQVVCDYHKIAAEHGDLVFPHPMIQPKAMHKYDSFPLPFFVDKQ